MSGKFFYIEKLARNFHGAISLMQWMKEIETKILLEKVKMSSSGKKDSEKLEKLTKKFYLAVEDFERFTRVNSNRFEVNRAFITFLFQGQKLNIIESYAQENSNKLRRCTKKFRRNKSGEIDIEGNFIFFFLSKKNWSKQKLY